MIVQENNLFREPWVLSFLHTFKGSFDSVVITSISKDKSTGISITNKSTHFQAGRQGHLLMANKMKEIRQH